jgi:hypothetical protein
MDNFRQAATSINAARVVQPARSLRMNERSTTAIVLCAAYMCIDFAWWHLKQVF